MYVFPHQTVPSFFSFATAQLTLPICNANTQKKARSNYSFFFFFAAHDLSCLCLSLDVVSILSICSYFVSTLYTRKEQYTREHKQIAKPCDVMLRKGNCVQVFVAQHIFVCVGDALGKKQRNILQHHLPHERAMESKHHIRSAFITNFSSFLLVLLLFFFCITIERV